MISPCAKRSLITALALLAMAGTSISVAQEPRLTVRATNGGQIELPGVTDLVGLTSAVEIEAQGEGSRIDLSSLQQALAVDSPLPSTLRARDGGTLQLNNSQIQIGNNFRLELAPGGNINAGVISLRTGGFLSGTGLLGASVLNGGTVSPGISDDLAGQLFVLGDYQQTTTGTLAISLDGFSFGLSSDQLHVSGNATLDGSLSIGSTTTDFTPFSGSRYQVLDVGQRSGEFSRGDGFTGGEMPLLNIDYADMRVDVFRPTGETACEHNALLFDGIDDEARAAGDFATPQFTVELWLHIGIDTPNDAALIGLGTAQAASWELLISRDENQQPRLGIAINRGQSEGPTLTTIGGNLTIGRWQHVAASYDGQTVRLFVNGIETAAQATTVLPSPAGAQLSLGRHLGGITGPFAGNLDELRIWNTARSAEQLLASRFNLLRGDEDGLLVWAPFEGEGQALLNLGPLGGNGQLGNLPVADATDPQRVASAAPVCLPPGASDEIGPSIDSATVNGNVLVGGLNVSGPSQIQVSASDASGLALVSIAVDGNELQTDRDDNGTTFTAEWNTLLLADGSHIISITATDFFGNSTRVNHTVTVTLATPPAPVLDEPLNGASTPNAQIFVTGTATAARNVTVTVNGQAAETVAVNSAGGFRALVTLAEGENSIQASASNRAGSGPATSARTVTLDSSVPAAPTNLRVRVEESGQLRLTWSQFENDVDRFILYRSTAPFDDVASANIISETIERRTFVDLPPAETIYYYRVIALNGIGTLSSPSNVASATADSTAPVASISYTPQGAFDTSTGRYGVGDVEIVLTASEVLPSRPFLTITPGQGLPNSILLQQTGQTEYRGTLAIKPGTPSGTAFAVFSARDAAGNRGTTVEQGSSLLIDTAGPAATNFTVSPGSPVRNDADAPVELSLTFQLSDVLGAGQLPQLGYHLSDDNVIPIALQPPATTDSSQWTGRFTLPASAGADGPETLGFTFHATDDIGNIADKIDGTRELQIYQGELPPALSPIGFGAVALPGGDVRLFWQPVEQAADYQLFRRGPGETTLSEIDRSGGAVEFIDSPIVDGDYRYAVASVRISNGQERVSALSNEASVTADSQPPAAPRDLVLSLLPEGIEATWLRPNAADAGSDANNETLRYNLYRSTELQLLDVTGLEPVVAGTLAIGAVDRQPQADTHTYAVTAVDASGNESPPSNSEYLNFDLLPVQSLQVVQRDDLMPLLSWALTGAAAGIDLLVGSETNQQRINSVPLTNTSYSDSGYAAASSRRYTLTAVDSAGVNSIGRSVLLPQIDIRQLAGTVKRGQFNRLQFELRNRSATALENVSLQYRIQSHEHQSASFDLEVGGIRTVDLVVGGYADLRDFAETLTTVRLEPNAGEVSLIERTGSQEVATGSLTVDLDSRNVTRGGTAELRFTVHNRGSVPFELITARNTGTSASDELRFRLRDVDDNVLVDQPLRSVFGEGLLTLPSGNTVATVAANGQYRSPWLTIDIPDSAPDALVAELMIDRVHHGLNSSDPISIGGTRARRNLMLIDTPYTGTVTTALPEFSLGQQPIIISGQAVGRDSGEPVANVLLQLILSIDGFEQRIEVTTDTNGQYSHSYQPTITQSGRYTVSALHPLLTERPEQASFVIGGVDIDPRRLLVRTPKNFQQPIRLEVRAAPTTAITGLQLLARPEDQPAGTLPQGLQLELPDAIDLSAGGATALEMTLGGDASAADSGNLILAVVSNESGSTPLQTINISYRYSARIANLVATPQVLETGLEPGDRITESLVIENNGLNAAASLSTTLRRDDGSAAPAWAFISRSLTGTNLDIGDTHNLELVIQPPATTPDDVYDLEVVITGPDDTASDGAEPETVTLATIPVRITVQQGGTGGVTFKLSDIYTATPDPDTGSLIPGLKGASIQLQHEQTGLLFDQTKITDELGEARFTDIPAGKYKYRAFADDHRERRGRLTIKPGTITTEEVFLNNTLISIEFSVNEITLEDRYELQLDVTFETDVPAAVVIMDPPVVNLPNMVPGEMLYGVINITNHGLVRADNVTARFPVGDDRYEYEFFADIPEEISAKQRVSVPYRVTRRTADFSVVSEASGGGCFDHLASADLDYDYTCANGFVGGNTSSAKFARQEGDTCLGTFFAAVNGNTLDKNDSEAKPKSGECCEAGGLPEPFPDEVAVKVCEKPQTYMQQFLKRGQFSAGVTRLCKVKTSTGERSLNAFDSLSCVERCDKNQPKYYFSGPPPVPNWTIEVATSLKGLCDTDSFRYPARYRERKWVTYTREHESDHSRVLINIFFKYYLEASRQRGYLSESACVSSLESLQSRYLNELGPALKREANHCRLSGQAKRVYECSMFGTPSENTDTEKWPSCDSNSVATGGSVAKVPFLDCEVAFQRCAN